MDHNLDLMEWVMDMDKRALLKGYSLIYKFTHKILKLQGDNYNIFNKNKF